MIGETEVRLSGARVVLRPLQLSDLPALLKVALDDDLWQHVPMRIRSEEDLRVYIETAIALRRAGSAVPFLTTLHDGTVVGSTRFGNIDAENRRVEIGWTWITKPWQRSFVNTESKYLMLRHAFETWKCVRVEFKTGSKNVRSRAAILRLGAREEGVLRDHMKLHDGSYRDTVYYSILHDEWPTVKKNLERRLAQPD